MNKQTTKLLLFSFLFVIFSTNILLGQEAILKGVITDEESAEPLIGATVRVGDAGTTTEYDGSYELKLTPGTHKILISFVGYADWEKEITINDSGATLDVNLSSGVLLDELIITTEKGEAKSIMEAIGTIEVVGSQLSSNTASPSVDDVLEKVPGVTIIDGQANIRGGSGYSYGAGSRVLLLINGIPALAGDAGNPSWNDIPMENIDQVEILKGAGSALYGSSALNGVINVKTAFAKSEPETEFSSFITYYMKPERDSVVWWRPQTQPHDFGASFAHRQKFGKLDMVLGSYFVQENGYRSGVHNRYIRGNANLRYRITDEFVIGLSSNFNTGSSEDFLYWKGRDSLAYHGEDGTDVATEMVRYIVDPYVNYRDGFGNRHRLQGRLYDVTNDNANNQSNSSQLYYGEYQFLRTFDGLGITTTAGLVGIKTDVQAELYSDTTFSSSNLSAYFQADKKFFEDTKRPLSLSFGARYENNVIKTPSEVEGFVIEEGRIQEGRPVFRFGANYTLFEHTSLRASWGQGYRFPTVAEKFIRTSAGLINIYPNPTLESETGWNAEFGIKQGFMIPGTSMKGLFDVSLFWTEYQDMMEFTFHLFEDDLKNTVLGFQSLNIGDTKIQGIDISLGGNGKLFDRGSVTFIGGYTFINPQFKDWDLVGADTMDFDKILTAPRGPVNAFLSSSENNILKYRFQHSFKFDIQFDLFGIIAGASINSLSNMEAVDQIFEDVLPGVREFREEHNNGVRFVDFRLGYQINENLKANFLLKNALNTESAVRPGIIDAPRNLTMRLDYKF